METTNHLTFKSEAGCKAYEAGLKTLKAYLADPHDFGEEYMAMGIVQDALRAFLEQQRKELL
jgi:hypothetical protein